MNAHLLVTLLLGTMVVTGAECDCAPPRDVVTDCGTLKFARGRELLIRADADLSSGYTVSVELDHYELVRRSLARASGDDVAIVLGSRGEARELHRVLDPTSGWERRDTRLFFALPEALETGDELRLALCYGRERAVVATDPREVYWHYSDFEAPADLAVDWRPIDTSTSFGAAQLSWSIVDGALYQSSDASYSGGVPYIAGKLLLVHRELPRGGVAVSYRYMSSQDDLLAVGVCSTSGDPAGFYVGHNDGDAWFDAVGSSAASGGLRGYWAGPGATAAVAAASLSSNGPHVVRASWTTSTTTLALDDEPEAQWAVAPAAGGHFCFAMNSMAETSIDELTIRELVEPAPSVELGDERRP